MLVNKKSNTYATADICTRMYTAYMLVETYAKTAMNKFAMNRKSQKAGQEERERE